MGVIRIGSKAGTQLNQYPVNNGANQEWLITKKGSYYIITNSYSKLVMDTSGDEVVQNNPSSAQSQQWQFVPVS
jgi:hypothetical protein